MYTAEFDAPCGGCGGTAKWVEKSSDGNKLESVTIICEHCGNSDPLHKITKAIENGVRSGTSSPMQNR